MNKWGETRKCRQGEKRLGKSAFQRRRPSSGIKDKRSYDESRWFPQARLSIQEVPGRWRKIRSTWLKTFLTWLKAGCEHFFGWKGIISALTWLEHEMVLYLPRGTQKGSCSPIRSCIQTRTLPFFVESSVKILVLLAVFIQDGEQRVSGCDGDSVSKLRYSSAVRIGWLLRWAHCGFVWRGDCGVCFGWTSAEWGLTESTRRAFCPSEHWSRSCLMSIKTLAPIGFFSFFEKSSQHQSFPVCVFELGVAQQIYLN